MQGFAVDWLALAARFGDRCDSFLRGGVHEVHAHLAVLRQPDDLAERQIL